MKKMSMMLYVMFYCIPIMAMNGKEETKALLVGDLRVKNAGVTFVQPIVHATYDAVEKQDSLTKAESIKKHRYMNQQGIVNSFVCKDACWPCVYFVTSQHCFGSNY